LIDFFDHFEYTRVERVPIGFEGGRGPPLLNLSNSALPFGTDTGAFKEGVAVMSRLSMYLLGPPRIELDGEPVQVDTRKAVALLAYLALTREHHRRDALVNLLWPESDQSHGRAALRRTLSALRKALADDWLDADREDIALNPHADLWVDVDQFHAHLQECRTHGHPPSDVCSACLAPLTAAAALYRGDFLSGFGLRDSFNFDDWQFFQTEGLRRELGETLERLVRCHSAEGDLEAAIRYARQWLDLDRLNEAAHGQLMLLYTRAGRRSAALRQYQECVRILESNLGVSPQESTADLYRAIVDGHISAPPAVPTPLAALSPRTDTGRRAQVSPPGQAVPAAPETRPLPLAGERRIVTVVYADIGCSLTVRGEVAPEQEASLVDGLLRLVEDVLPRYGGHVGRPLGTGVLGILGATRIHESDPELAIRAAIEMRREAEALGLTVSAGVNTGQVYLRGEGDRKPVPVGTVVDTAVRLAGQAQAGQILVGESTYRLARRAFEFTPLVLQAGGIEGMVAAYRVERLLPHPRKARGIEGLRAELIGRDGELSTLQGAFAQVLRGRGQMVSLIGEAGVGKSRLVAELREIALAPGDDRAMPLWLEGRCLELGTPTGYAPFVDILREYLAWRPGEEERRRRESIVYSLRRLVERGDLAEERAQEMGPLLGRLLSVRWGADTDHPDEWDDRLAHESAEQIRNRTFAALYNLVLALSRQRPVVLVFEDLHWADTLSLDLISLLMEALPRGPLLLLCLYRPEREHRCWHLATVAAQKCREHYTELTLRELTHQQSRQMVESLLAMEVLPPGMRDRVLAQSQGNPFFIEELVRSLIDAGIVYKEGDAWHTRQESGTAAVPESVQSVILGRVDRLEERLKHVLQMASVIGRVFGMRVLARALPDEPNVESAMWELEERALVYQERAVPEVEYSFKHVLTREAVYHNVPQPSRQALHRQVAEAVEALYAGNLEEYSEQLAHHYDQGGDVERAVGYLFQAGEKAKRSYANEEAITQLNRGLELLRTSPDMPERAQQELDLLVSLGVPLVLTRGHAAPEVQRTYARALALSVRLGDTVQRFHVLMGLRRFYLHRGELEMARALGEQLLALAQSTRDPIRLSRAHMMHGETLYSLGEFTQAREHCERGLAAYDQRQRRSHLVLYGNDTCTGCRIVHAQAIWCLGYPDQAVREVDELLVLAQELGHPFNLVFALYFCACVHQLRREAQVVRERTEAMLRISTEQDFALYLAWGKCLHGWALAVQGWEAADMEQLSAGIEQIEVGIAARRAEGGVSLLTQLLALLAEVCGQTGRAEDALGQIGEALDLVSATGECFWQAELYRLRGEVLLMRRHSTSGREDARDVEACFQRALDIAHRQRARSWELRAATSMARLWQRQGRTEEARALLRGIYGWFTEGLDTPDLREARALLDALA
jgi:predicted ATPase/DNA-binding SARP family transcriptional activator/class 3 adenylate cyclase